MSLRQTCDSCERSFDSLLKKKIHEQQIHVYIHQCEECSIKFKSLDDLQKHKESAHTNKSYDVPENGGDLVLKFSSFNF